MLRGICVLFERRSVTSPVCYRCLHTSGEDVQEKILAASLEHVDELGWSKDALIRGAESTGLPTIAHSIFPGGGVDLFHYFYKSSRKRLSIEMEEYLRDHAHRSSVSDVINLCVRRRLSMNVPYSSHLAQGLATTFSPPHTVRACNELAKLADDIWHITGDTTTDVTWYTKRASLAFLYKSMEVHMSQDESADFTETWSAVDRAVGNLELFSKASHKLQSISVERTLAGTLTTALNMLSLNHWRFSQKR